MKCPRCSAESHVLETTTGKHGTVARRCECEQGHRFTTVEAVQPPNERSVAYRTFMKGLRAAAEIFNTGGKHAANT